MIENMQKYIFKQTRKTEDIYLFNNANKGI